MKEIKLMTNKQIHIESLTQVIVGLLISFVILHLWGMSFGESVVLQTIFLVVSYIRSYMIRYAFSIFWKDN